MKYIELTNCQLKIIDPQFESAYVEPVSDKFSEIWHDELREELDEIKERLAKLENKNEAF